MQFHYRYVWIEIRLIHHASVLSMRTKYKNLYNLRNVMGVEVMRGEV